MKRIFSILILLIIFFSIATPFCFADGSFTDTTLGYNYSLIYKSGYVGNNIVVIQSKEPFYVGNNKDIYLKGDFRVIAFTSTIPTITTFNNAIYKTDYIYSEILESSIDIVDVVTKQVIYQAGQKDLIGVDPATVNYFKDSSKTTNNLLTSIYVFIAFAITVSIGGFVIYVIFRPLFYFIR